MHTYDNGLAFSNRIIRAAKIPILEEDRAPILSQSEIYIGKDAFGTMVTKAP